MWLRGLGIVRYRTRAVRLRDVARGFPGKACAMGTTRGATIGSRNTHPVDIVLVTVSGSIFGGCHTTIVMLVTSMVILRTVVRI